MAAITIGYQLPEARIPEDQREREYAPRNRRPLEESFFCRYMAKTLRMMGLAARTPY